MGRSKWVDLVQCFIALHSSFVRGQRGQNEISENPSSNTGSCSEVADIGLSHVETQTCEICQQIQNYTIACKKKLSTRLSTILLLTDRYV